MSGNEHMRVVDTRRNALFFRSRNEMVEQYSEASLTTRSECSNSLTEIIRPMERFDHDPHLTKFIAPYVLDEFGIMDSLDPHPMWQRDSGACHTIGQDTAGSRDLLRRSRCRLGSHQGDGAPFEQEPAWLPPEVTKMLTPVTQGDTLG